MDVRKLADAVMTATADATSNASEIVRRLASNLTELGSIDRVAMLLHEADHARFLGPLGVQSVDAVVEESIPALEFPATPRVCGSPRLEVPLERALFTRGMHFFTLVPILTGDICAGVLGLGHPTAPADDTVDSASVLMLLGRHLGSLVVQRKALSADELSALALTGQLSSLGKIAGGLIHEINNPATFVALAGGQIEKFAAKAGESDGPADMKPVLELTAGIRESARQIRDLVAAFRLLVGVANRSVVVTVDLERVLKAAVEMTHVAHRHDAMLEMDFEPMPPCPGCCVQLGPVVVHVLVNAIESLRSSGERKVSVEGRVRDESVQLRIRDTGEGIAPEVLPRVFDPFFTTRDRRWHAGLGLTLTRETVSTLGGRIEIDSEVSKGTTVRINVPVGNPLGKGL